ncbi:MAG: sensor histidine kinase [Chloroflexota bacterium]
MFNRTRGYLAAWNLLVLACILVAVGGVAYVVLSRSLISRIDQTLGQQSEEVAGELQRQDFRGSDLHLEREGYRGGAFILVVAADGRPLANPQGVALPLAALPAAFNGSLQNATVTVNGGRARVAVREIHDRTGIAAALIVGESLASEEDTLHELFLVFLGGGVLGLVLSIVGAWFLAGRALVPIHSALDRQREFVADASHELRTPLTVLSAGVDLLNHHRDAPLEANGELFDDVREGIMRLERLAGDLLTLARSDLGELALAIGEVELGAFIADVVRQVLPLAHSRQVELDARASGPVVIEADPDRLQQVLLILLDNALKHTRPGGCPPGRVRIMVQSHGEWAIIEVSDNGEGIPAEHVPRLFERFYRVNRARSRQDGGAGLGLAIARTLIAAHGGRIALTSKLGLGTTVTIQLPLHGRAESLVGRLGQFATRISDQPLSE